MLDGGVRFAKYGAAYDLYFGLEDITDAEAPFTGTAPLAADIWLIKDGGTPANATNASSAIGNGVYKLTLTATEMQATNLAISIYDATASAIFKPKFLNIHTRVELGSLVIDPTNIGGNTVGLNLVGVGTGMALNVNGASASYNHNLLDQSEVAELSSAPTGTVTFKQMLQWLFRRWRNKHTASSSQLLVYKDDGTTVLSTQTLAYSGSIQSVAAMS